jgi:hypothetical protein
MPLLIITLADLQAVRPVASNIGSSGTTDRLSMYIDEARRMDLQPALTAELLNKIDIDMASPLEYADLLAGCVYIHKHKTYKFAGLIKTLAYFVYARFIKGNSINPTAFGVVTKTDSNSEAASDKRLVMMANDAYDIGVAYLADCLDYIGRTWPTQDKSELSTQKKFDISAIGD